MRFKELVELPKKIGAIAFVNKYAPDARPMWKGCKYFMYNSATHECLGGYKTLVELEKAIRDRARWIEKRNTEISAMEGVPGGVKVIRYY